MVANVPVPRIPVVVLDLFPASAPMPTGVLSRNNRVINWFAVSEAQESNEYITKILLLVALGVIEADKPVMSEKVELVILNVSVFVVDTTCNTLPAGTAGASFTQFVPLYVNNWLSTGEVILTPERLVNAKESIAVSLASITSAVAFQIVGNVLGSEPLAGVVPPESLVTAINQSIRNIR